MKNNAEFAKLFRFPCFYISNCIATKNHKIFIKTMFGLFGKPKDKRTPKEKVFMCGFELCKV